MTTEHDFKKALRAVKSWSKDWNSHNEATLGDMVFINHEDEIIFALRLADKLLKQEPSEGMWRSAMGLRNEDNDFDPDYDRVLQAMIEQAVKEIEDD